MKTRLLLTLLGVLAAGAVGLSGTAVAQGQGGGGGNGGGGGGGNEAPDFGDLIILLRNDNGVPIPSASVQVPDPETGLLVEGGLCWQPIADEDFSYEGWTDPAPDRVVVPTESTAVDGGWLIPVDQYTCGVEGFFSSYTREVEFGRVNEARSPESVFDAQLEDVIIKLATADSTSLDPAGRMVASNCGVDEETVTRLEEGAQVAPVRAAGAVRVLARQCGKIGARRLRLFGDRLRQLLRLFLGPCDREGRALGALVLDQDVRCRDLRTAWGLRGRRRWWWRRRTRGR